MTETSVAPSGGPVLREKTKRLRISEVIAMWIAGRNEGSSYPPGKNNWYGYRNSGWGNADPALVISGTTIRSNGVVDLGYRFVGPGGYWFLLNADGFPRWGRHAINDHQTEIRQAVNNAGAESYLLPFSVLAAASLNPKDLVFLDRTPDREEEVPADTCKWCAQGMDAVSPCANRWNGNWEHPMKTDKPHEFTRTRHIMGGSVFMVEEKESRYEGDRSPARYFVSGIDETGASSASYFLTELKVAAGDKPPATYAAAIALLMPGEVKTAERQRREVLRQGEWFLIRASEEEEIVLDTKHKILRKRQDDVLTGKAVASSPDAEYLKFTNIPLVPPDEKDIRWGRAHNHVAAVYITLGDNEYITKRLVHQHGDHSPVKMAGWYQVVHNVQVQSWNPERGGRRAGVD